MDKSDINNYNQSLLAKHKSNFEFISTGIKDVEIILQKLIDFQIAIN